MTLNDKNFLINCINNFIFDDPLDYNYCVTTVVQMKNASSFFSLQYVILEFIRLDDYYLLWKQKCSSERDGSKNLYLLLLSKFPTISYWMQILYSTILFRVDYKKSSHSINFSFPLTKTNSIITSKEWINMKRKLD
mgnify:CR=1 FL=1